MQDALRGLPGLRGPRSPEGHAHYRCVAFTEGDLAPETRDRLLAALHAAGIPAMHGSCAEIDREHAFERRGLRPASTRRGRLDADGRLPNARRLGETSLTFLVHHTIDASSMERYAMAARHCIRHALSPVRVV
jgi:dTDP-4-amino-4,6-dideoxygalactose transaminase